MFLILKKIKDTRENLSTGFFNIGNLRLMFARFVRTIIFMKQKYRITQEELRKHS